MASEPEWKPSVAARSSRRVGRGAVSASPPDFRMSGSRAPDSGEPADGCPLEREPAAKMPRPLRLRTRAEFLATSRGRRLHGRCFSLQIFRRGETEPTAARFGLTVTKKTGDAVERNRIRRRLREVLRMPGLAPEPGHDYVIVARRDALEVPFTTLVAELSKTLSQAREAKGRQRGGRGPIANRTGSGPRNVSLP